LTALKIERQGKRPGPQIPKELPAPGATAGDSGKTGEKARA
jgi:hypothetical protein